MKMELKPRRNDPSLNKYNKLILQLWRANMDIAPVISKQAVRVQSQALHEIFNSIIDRLDGDLKAKKIIHKVFMQSCAERDIGAQEVCHSLLRLKLFSSGGRRFVVLNLSKKKWIQLQSVDDDVDEPQKSGKSTVEKYVERPNWLQDLSLWECAKKYDFSTWSAVTKENIVRVFPRMKKKHEPESNEDYYNTQALLHIPWRNEKDLKTEEESWEDIYIKHNLSKRVKTMSKIGHDDENVVDDDYLTNDSENSDDDDANLIKEFLSSRLGPQCDIPCISLGNRTVDVNYNWKDSYKNYEKYGTISDFENFIEKMKGTSQNVQQSSKDLSDIVFSDDQLSVINVVKEQIKKIQNQIPSNGGDQDIKRIIIQGKAGTGKSLIIKYISNLLCHQLGSESYILAAPTGVSAVLINGKTLHSVFKLPRKSKNFIPLKGELEREPSNTLRNVKFLILDEYSMIGCTTLAMINKRCQQAKASVEEFGGLNVLLLGDIKQLPPVKDYAFYSKSQNSMLGKEGKALINSFQRAFILTTCHRQRADFEFLNVLDNLSESRASLADYNYLSSRFTHVVSQEEKDTFKDAIRLFPTKDQVKQYNMEKLAEMKDFETGDFCPVVKINAMHNCSSAKKGSTDDAEGLEKVLFLSKGCKVMLRSNLWIDHKLCNGTIGKVHDVIYPPSNDTDFPSVLLCEFETYDGPSVIPNTKIVPIKPILKSWQDGKGNNCTRYQFPVTLCYACSIHKSQGMTLDKAVVNIGDVDFSLGLSYVALSRVRCLNDLLIEPFLYNRLKPSARITANIETRQDFLSEIIHNLS